MEDGIYEKLGSEIGTLVAKKQEAYGSSFSKSGEVMRILYPSGVPLEKLDDALTVVRVLDKLFRIATDRDALGESPWRDIAGYALLSVRRAEGKTPGEQKPEERVDCRWCGNRGLGATTLSPFCNSVCRDAWEAK